ncbi:glucosaminidase domain-containing protein [SAR116 cluster bacterium]|nr:glucosaminidase domain-containing protein [SAR116 cluster bacterium]
MLGPGIFRIGPPQWITPHDEPEDIAKSTLPEKVVTDSAKIDVAKAEITATDPSYKAVPNTVEAKPVTPTPPASVDQQTRANPPTRADQQLNQSTQAKQWASKVDQPETPPQPEQPAVHGKVEKDTSSTTKLASVTPPAAKVPPPKNLPNEPIIVSRLFVKRISQVHVDLLVKEQKASFIAMTLPLILAANDEIKQRRTAIIRGAKNDDRSAIERWAKLYKVKTENKSIAMIEEELLRRADVIPVSLALSQAAIESGWGTSRFALKGNALFGQWAWQRDAGLRPLEASNSNAVVRSFPNLFGSVRAYMHNLNTHASYNKFRERRYILRGRQRDDMGYQLAGFLDSYAEIGMQYVDKLRDLMRINSFSKYDTARLQ